MEQSIQAAMRRGEFDQLPGKGQPIAGLDAAHDELWWVKDKLRREDISTVPESLSVRRDRDELRSHLHAFTTERTVREAVEELNERIRKLNRYGSSNGPPTSLMTQDVDEYIARWREATATD